MKKGKRKFYNIVVSAAGRADSHRINRAPDTDLTELDRFAESLARWTRDLAEADEGDPQEKAFLKRRLQEIDEYLDAGRHLVEMLTREGKVTPATIKKIRIT